MENENKKRKKTGLLLSILGVMSLVLITAGVTYAFFSYAKEGQTTNTISTGTLEFTYTEVDDNSNGILIQDALPMTDAEGKVLGGNTQVHSELTANRNVFLFTVTSKTTSKANIPYIVTAKKQDGSTLDDSQIKLYLTATQTGTNNTVSGENVNTFAYLKANKALGSNTTVFSQYNTENPTNQLTADANEVVLFEGTVPASQSAGYTNSFVLRMWLNGEAAGATSTAVDYSPYEFVLKTAVGATALDAKTLIANNQILKSTDYYALSENGSCSDNTSTTEAACTAASGTWTASPRDAYERIAYVKDDSIITVSQTGVDHTGYTASEQYYELRGQTFSVKVNVYANAAVIGG